MKSGTDVRSSVPKKYGDLKKCPVRPGCSHSGGCEGCRASFVDSILSPSARIAEFKHPDFPAGCKHFPNDVLPGVRTKDCQPK